MKRLGVLVIACLLMAGCASITAVPLDPVSFKKTGGEPGIRYYMPKPYLLVMELPPVPAAPSTPKNGKMEEQKGGGDGQSKGGNAGAGAGKDNSGSSSGNSSQTSLPTAPPADTSFSVANSLYTAKIIYLPDFEHPMALQMTSGVFGNSSMAPTLQDGWMLTSLSGSSDSGGANVLNTLLGSTGSIANAVASKFILSRGAAPEVPPAWSKTILAPGLYEFQYTDGKQQLAPVFYFCLDGIHEPAKDGGTPCPR